MSSFEFEIPSQQERAPQTPISLDDVRYPRYGRFLEELNPGAVFSHPRGLTVHGALAQEFATTFMQANPLFLNEPYAQAHGFESTPLPPLMVLNLALSLGVQNDSEQAIAHLGYYSVEFPRPAYPGDTLRSETSILGRRARGAGQPGVVRMYTRASNQREQVVVQYERAVLIPPGDMAELDPESRSIGMEVEAPSVLRLQLPAMQPGPLSSLTGRNTYFDDFKPGAVIAHPNGRTVTDEHLPWAYRLGNTHPLHYDRVYSAGRSGPLSGEPVVFGGLVFAWLEGLASRDTSENALWDLGYTEGYHRQPVLSGDTLYPLTRVLHKEDGPSDVGAGIVTFQLIGLKNISGRDALERYGTGLFQKESDKAKEERIPEKAFEVERRLLLKKRSAWPDA